jgi:hypothetical protein
MRRRLKTIETGVAGAIRGKAVWLECLEEESGARIRHCRCVRCAQDQRRLSGDTAGGGRDFNLNPFGGLRASDKREYLVGV